MTKILEVNDDGTLLIPADLLGGVGSRKRYVAESAGQGLLLRPEPGSAEKPAPDEWWRQWDSLAERIGRSWSSDATAAQAVEETRR